MTENSQEFDLVVATKSTASNLYDLMIRLAEHIQRLETENAELKSRFSNDVK
jgi:hypothetical protein